jgi:hypothetical protein
MPLPWPDLVAAALVVDVGRFHVDYELDDGSRWHVECTILEGEPGNAETRTANQE